MKSSVQILQCRSPFCFYDCKFPCHCQGDVRRTETLLLTSQHTHPQSRWGGPGMSPTGPGNGAPKCWERHQTNRSRALARPVSQVPFGLPVYSTHTLQERQLHSSHITNERMDVSEMSARCLGDWTSAYRTQSHFLASWSHLMLGPAYRVRRGQPPASQTVPGDILPDGHLCSNHHHPWLSSLSLNTNTDRKFISKSTERVWGRGSGRQPPWGTSASPLKLSCRDSGPIQPTRGAPLHEPGLHVHIHMVTHGHVDTGAHTSAAIPLLVHPASPPVAMP